MSDSIDMSPINDAFLGDSLRFTLTPTNSPDDRRVAELRPGQIISIGRSHKYAPEPSEPDRISFRNPTVSRNHAELRIVSVDGQDTISLIDCGSLHGTYVSDHRLEPNKPCRLHCGDIIRLGSYVTRGSQSHDGLTVRFEKLNPNSIEDPPYETTYRGVYHVPSDSDSSSVVSHASEPRELTFTALHVPSSTTLTRMGSQVNLEDVDQVKRSSISISHIVVPSSPSLRAVSPVPHHIQEEHAGQPVWSVSDSFRHETIDKPLNITSQFQGYISLAEELSQELECLSPPEGSYPRISYRSDYDSDSSFSSHSGLSSDNSSYDDNDSVDWDEAMLLAHPDEGDLDSAPVASASETGVRGLCRPFFEPGTQIASYTCSREIVERREQSPLMSRVNLGEIACSSELVTDNADKLSIPTIEPVSELTQEQVGPVITECVDISPAAAESGRTAWREAVMDSFPTNNVGPKEEVQAVVQADLNAASCMGKRKRSSSEDDSVDSICKDRQTDGTVVIPTKRARLGTKVARLPWKTFIGGATLGAISTVGFLGSDYCERFLQWHASL